MFGFVCMIVGRFVPPRSILFTRVSNPVLLNCYIPDVDSYSIAKVNLFSVMNALYRFEVSQISIAVLYNAPKLQHEYLNQMIMYIVVDGT